MPFFVINGKPNCRNFVHAVHVAQYLSDKLPDFHFTCNQYTDYEWNKILYNLNKENGWHLTKCPAIWKEINLKGGKKRLIGGLSEFWEYCYDYYGLESKMSAGDLEKLVEDNLTIYEHKTNEHIIDPEHVFIIGIIGVNSPLIYPLLKELFNVPGIEKEKGIFVKVYKSRKEDNYIIRGFMDDLNNEAIYGKQELCSIFDNYGEFVMDCDLIIHIKEYPRETKETDNEWHRYLADQMLDFADVLDYHGKKSLRIIFSNLQTPSCFLATFLLEYCTKIKLTNIVAITSDEGLSAINLVSKLADIDTFKLSAPPIWGFPPFYRFVDVWNTIIKADVYYPFKRAVTAKEGATLPLGVMQSDLRPLSYLIPCDFDEFHELLDKNRDDIKKKLGRAPIRAKLRSLVYLIKIWWQGDQESIISLGVCSNGTFGIPNGIVFSQPVNLNRKGEWQPFTDFPISEMTKDIINGLFKPTKQLVDSVKRVDFQFQNIRV